ncbi:MAG: hypothetical protein J6U51_05640, partial [Bacteroidales bacterium]|nr:hypothetical protein [Bacteroidales bacterium]
MKFEIYSKYGEVVRYSGYPKYVGTYLGVPYLEFSSIESPTPINWEIGDYISYSRTGQKYYLHSVPQPKKQARSGEYGAAFVYSNVKFYSEIKDLEVAFFRDIVSEDNGIHFSTRPDVNTFESVYGIATRIQENLDEIFPGKWSIEVVESEDEELSELLNEAKDFSLSNGTCLDALTQIYEVWKNIGWTYSYKSEKHTITLGSTYFRTEENTTGSYGYGKGKGLISLKKASSNDEDFATRLYVYGSTRNVPSRYYNGLDILNKDSVDIVNLMIPLDKWGKTDGLPDARKAYIQADDATIEKYGIIPRIVYFDGNGQREICPSIKGLTFREVRQAMLDSGAPTAYLPDDIDSRIDVVYGTNNLTDGGSKAEYEANKTFYFGIPSNIGFDVVEQGKLTAEGVAVFSMKTGMCAGREFKVKDQIGSLDGSVVFELERVWDESLGMAFPNKTFPVSQGDQYVILDIPLPDFYITIAQDKLYEAGKILLEESSRFIPFYEPLVDTIVAVNDKIGLREGMYMQIQDEDV